MKQDEIQGIMYKASESRDRLGMISYDTDPYRYLADAIVCMAADDYRFALERNNKKLIKDLEKFFNSDWAKLISSVSPVLIMRLIRKQKGVYCET